MPFKPENSSYPNQPILSPINTNQQDKKPFGEDYYSLNEPQIIPQTSTNQSSFSKYQQFMSEIQNNHRPIQQLIEQLRKNGINYDQKLTRNQNLKHHFQIIQIKPTNNFQVVSFQVSLGPFCQTINIHNAFELSTLFEADSINYGHFSRIHEINFRQKNYILKCYNLTIIPTTESLSFHVFMNSLREVFITKMMSALKIGLKFCTQFGFDLFLSSKEIFFFLELCEPPHEEIIEEGVLDLKKGLKQMHMLQILHADIKPDNIMYSPWYKKLVFIDFGISQFKYKRKGELVYTSFLGSYAYCTYQMKRLYENGTSAWVDVYENDVFGLEMSIQQIKIPKIWFDVNDYGLSQLSQKSQLQELIEILIIKHALFVMNYDRISELKNQFNLKISKSIMRFLYEIPLTGSIRKIYKEYLQIFISEQEEFQDLKQFFKNKVFLIDFQGQRVFANNQQIKQVFAYENFYKYLYKRYQLQSNLQFKMIPHLQEIPYANFINSHQPFEQFAFLIEYLSYDKIDSSVSPQKKLEACIAFISIKKILLAKKLQQLTACEAILIVFQQIIREMNVTQKVMNFRLYLKILHNYGLFSTKTDKLFLEDIKQVLVGIDKAQNKTLLQKIQSVFIVIFYLQQLIQKCDEIQTYYQVQTMKQWIMQKIKQYKTEIKEEGCRQIAELYTSSLTYFISDEYLPSHWENPCQLLHQIKNLKKTNSNSPSLLCYNLQKKFFNLVEFAGFSLSRKYQIQSKLLSDFKDQNSILSLQHLVLFYHRWQDTQNLTKYIKIFDQAIQIPEIYQLTFLQIRLYLTAMEYQQLRVKNNEASNQLLKKIKSFLQVGKYISSRFLSKIICVSTLSIRLDSQSQISQQINRIIIAKIHQALQTLQSQDKPTNRFGLSNLVYLELLQKLIQLQIKQKYMSKNQFLVNQDLANNQLFLKSYQTLVSTKGFHKIINSDRSNFTRLDHVILVFYDVIGIYHSQNQDAVKKIYDYLSDRKQLICEFFCYENSKQKTSIFQSFHLLIVLLNMQTDTKIFKQAIELIISILNTEIAASSVSVYFILTIYSSLLKLQKFLVIFKAIKDFYYMMPRNLSPLMLDFISHFYKDFFDEIEQLELSKSFDKHLNQFLLTLDCSEIPSIGTFLIFAVTDYNRQVIIMKIHQCLKFISYHGRVFILQRFYKQLLKIEKYSALKKKKLILRKDLAHSSDFKKTLQELKLHLNLFSKDWHFHSIFRAKISLKLMKLSE